MMLTSMLRRLIKIGELTVIDAEGVTHRFRGSPGPSAAVRFADRATEWQILTRPDPALGEAFMNGRLEILEGSLYDFLDLCTINTQPFETGVAARFSELAGRALRRIHQYNPVGRAQANVHHHYDLSDELYELFLDPDRQYSCAYFPTPETSLAEAQLWKKHHLAAKLQVQPGQTVLDIGSGWGGLGLHLAREAGADVTGLTLSTQQHEVSNARATKAGLSGRARFLMRDYREMTGEFDRIVSVGMFEHVGINHFDQYFQKVRELLKPDGIAVIHFIGRMSGPYATSAFIRKYIFPGGYIPALSEVMPSIERAGLWVTDVEALRLHYAMTLRHWRQNFLANRERVKQLYDERFCRMWEFYLVASELFFRRQDGLVFQIQLARDQQAVPLTRDYIGAYEQNLGRPSTAQDIAA